MHQYIYILYYFILSSYTLNKLFCRINVNANNNIPEPIHAVNVNAERWKVCDDLFHS